MFERIVQQVERIKADARQFGREIEVYTQGQVICRPTQKEAEDYHHYANVENADWPAIERMLALQEHHAAKHAGGRICGASGRCRRSAAIGGYPFVGTPDKVAEEFADLSRAGVRGIAVSFVNYLNDVPYFCAEVLPRLQRMGLRAN